MSYLRGLEASQWWSLDQLQALQNQKLRRLMAHVYQHVPFYADLMREHGLTPADIQTTDDLVKLPIVDKYVLTNNYPDHIRDQSLPQSRLIGVELQRLHRRAAAVLDHEAAEGHQMGGAVPLLGDGGLRLR